MVQRYSRYEGVGWVKFHGKKHYVTLEWPLRHDCTLRPLTESYTVDVVARVAIATRVVAA